MLMTTSAAITSTSIVVISLTRSGIRPVNRTRDRHRPGLGGLIGSDGPAGRALGAGAAIERSLRGGKPEHVTDPAQRVDQARLDRVDLPAQHRDVGLHDPGVAAEVVVPD